VRAASPLRKRSLGGPVLREDRREEGTIEGGNTRRKLPAKDCLYPCIQTASYDAQNVFRKARQRNKYAMNFSNIALFY
jgi:hypothetical protein